MSTKLKTILVSIFLLAILTPLTPALAGPTDPPVTVVKLVNPIGGIASKPEGMTDIRMLLGDIIQGVMGIAGSLILAVFVYGGFLWLTSAGNAEQVKKGSATMMWAAIGLFLIFGAYAILSLVLEAIGAKDQPATPIDTAGDVPGAEKEYQCECTDTIQQKTFIKDVKDKEICEGDSSDPGQTIICKFEEVKK